MTKLGTAAACAVAMGWCAPTMAQGFDSNSPKTLEQQINEKCAGRAGEFRQQCKNRIQASYQSHLNRQGAADDSRERRARAQANQRMNTQAKRIIDAQRNAQAPE